MTKIAIVQKKPAFNQIDLCVNLAIKYIENAASKDAEIVVFGECWFSGYPFWIDHLPHVAKWDYQPVKAAWAEIFANGLALESRHLNKLCSAAAKNNVLLVLGANEPITKGPGNSSIYNSVFIIDKNGQVKNHHRKLVPTFNEKLIHNHGDGHGLKSVLTDCGRIGSLICWEHWMPLARQAMHDQAEDIHFALWPCVKEQHILACRQYAIEGRCYVVAVGQIASVTDIPPQLNNEPHGLEPDRFVLNGGSCAFGPNGEVMLSPQYDKENTLYVHLPSNDELIGERMNLAVSGHYQRPDVFDFRINRKRYF